MNDALHETLLSRFKGHVDAFLKSFNKDHLVAASEVFKIVQLSVTQDKRYRKRWQHLLDECELYFRLRMHSDVVSEVAAITKAAVLRRDLVH